MKIGFDIMGGDYAPIEAIKGTKLFFEQETDESVHLLLIGDSNVVKEHLSILEPFKERYTFVDATQVIGMQEHPTKALKEKPDSSIAKGFGMLHMQKADAFIGAGNTGAMMVGAMYTVKTIPGVIRPTIASPIPQKSGGYAMLVDAGINADCKPENLVQFSHMASLYMKKIYGVSSPKVGLLNIGEEEGKGNLLAQATYPLLKEDKDLNFAGNIEGRDIFVDKADVIACEGFVGNVVLKMAESFYDIFSHERGLKDSLLETFNYEIYGGTPILGVNAPVIIGHGISHALAFKNMIDVARKMVDTDLIDVFTKHFAQFVEQK